LITSSLYTFRGLNTNYEEMYLNHRVDESPGRAKKRKERSLFEWMKAREEKKEERAVTHKVDESQ
jgi:hypothetical protein